MSSAKASDSSPVRARPSSIASRRSRAISRSSSSARSRRSSSVRASSRGPQSRSRSCSSSPAPSPRPIATESASACVPRSRGLPAPLRDGAGPHRGRRRALCRGRTREPLLRRSVSADSREPEPPHPPPRGPNVLCLCPRLRHISSAASSALENLADPVADGCDGLGSFERGRSQPDESTRSPATRQNSPCPHSPDRRGRGDGRACGRIRRRPRTGRQGLQHRQGDEPRGPASSARDGLYREVMFGRSELSRAERELLAVVVSRRTTATTESRRMPTTSVPRAPQTSLQNMPRTTTGRRTSSRGRARSATSRPSSRRARSVGEADIEGLREPRLERCGDPRRDPGDRVLQLHQPGRRGSRESSASRSGPTRRRASLPAA